MRSSPRRHSVRRFASSGALEKRARAPLTAMKNEKSSGHAAALLKELLDLLLWADRAPKLPVKKFHRAKERRELRRAAARLREGNAQTPSKSGHTAEGTAAIPEPTAQP